MSSPFLCSEQERFIS